MIRTYGLHWAANSVIWGKPGPGGHGELLGSELRGDAKNRIDFRDQCGIYALYSGFELVYVGQTGSKQNRLLNRLRSHLSDHLAERWERFSWFGTRWVKTTEIGMLSADAVTANTSTKVALNVMEAVAIAISEPRLNLQRGKWDAAKAKQYFQIASGQDEDPD